MHRRQILKKGVVGAAAAAALAGVPNIQAARKRFRWRMVMVVPKTFKIWGPGMIDFAEKVKVMSGGSLRIKVYGANELVPALETFDAVKKGQVEMGHSAAYYWRGKIPASVFFTSVPFGMNAIGMNSWINAGGGQALWDELYAPHSLKALPCGNTGVQMGGWFKKEIKTLADFKGLKMRMPGVGGEVITRAGAKAVLLPGADIYPSLETGVIDATEWIGPYHDYLQGFHKVAKYYYTGGWHEPGSVLELIINRKKWAELPDELKQIVKSCAAETNMQMYFEWQNMDALTYQKLKAEKKTEFREYPEDIIRHMHKVSDEVLANIAKTSPLAKRIYDSFTGFQKRHEAYQEISEIAYMRAQKA